MVMERHGLAALKNTKPAPATSTRSCSTTGAAMWVKPQTCVGAKVSTEATRVAGKASPSPSSHLRP